MNDEEPKPELRKPANIPAKPISIAKKYEGYEHLLNIDEEYADDGKLPSDIHGNVRALQYALDHPLIFTDHSSKHLVRSITKRKKQKVSRNILFLGSISLRSGKPSYSIFLVIFLV